MKTLLRFRSISLILIFFFFSGLSLCWGAVIFQEYNHVYNHYIEPDDSVQWGYSAAGIVLDLEDQNPEDGDILDIVEGGTFVGKIEVTAPDGNVYLPIYLSYGIHDPYEQDAIAWGIDAIFAQAGSWPLFGTSSAVLYDKSHINVLDTAEKNTPLEALEELDTTPEIVYPGNGSEIPETKPTFKWLSFPHRDSGYFFDTYESISLYSPDGEDNYFNSEVFNPSLGSEEISVPCPVELAPGEYRLCLVQGVEIKYLNSNAPTGDMISHVHCIIFFVNSPNEPPIIESIIGPDVPIKVGNVSSFSADFSDPNIDDTHTAIWDWGDNTTSEGEVVESNGFGTVSGSHVYNSSGVYTVSLTVIDDHEAQDTETYNYIVVYDPDGGFVTGGGWIWSEAGWCQFEEQCSNAEGKANFGFVSKYKRGATVPTGNTEFNFSAGSLNFHSDKYEWMVVNQNATNAQFKGSGTINGEGDYKFMLWAGDDDPDTFRIRIWEEDALENETDIYDNGFDQEIGGGSIVIHTKSK